MKQILDHFPHLHVIVLIIIGCLILWKLSDFIKFSKEVMSEQNVDGTIGKGSSKRVVIIMIASSFVYGWIYSLHTGTFLDKYVVTFIFAFLFLSLKILAPEQMNTLLDKFKDLTTFKEDSPKKEEEKKPVVTATTTTEIKTEQK